MTRCILTLVFLALFFVGASAQDDVWADILEDEDYEEQTGEMLTDELEDLLLHPIPLNSATREDLQRIPFLNDRQIEEICEYLYRHGPMKTKAELMMIASLDYSRRRLLERIVWLDEGKGENRPAVKERHSLMGSLNVPFYRRKGDRNGYLGYPYKHWLRYEYTRGDRLKAGLTATQDAGEPFGCGGNNMGYDHYAPYLLVRQWGRIETLALGLYKVSWGQGLVAGRQFSLGKAAMLDQLGRTTVGIRANSSRSVADYFQGAAVSVRLDRRFVASAFASYRPMDATLNDDGTAATLVKTGYHRTPTEYEKKNNLHATAFGFNATYRDKGFHAGFSALYSHLDRRLSPKTSQDYRRYYPAGNDFTNFSVDYGYTHHTIILNGETAVGKKGCLASVNTVAFTPNSALSLLLAQHFYGFRYEALYASGFGGSRTQNESGLCLGVDWTPWARWRVKGYADWIYHPWKTTTASIPSYELDASLTLSRMLGNWELSCRYRLKGSQRDAADGQSLEYRWSHRCRLRAKAEWGGGWHSQSQCEVSRAEADTWEWGYLLSQDFGYGKGIWRFSLSGAYFNTESYDSRLYVYERSLRYGFSFPAFSGQGIRYTAVVRANFGFGFRLGMKLGVTDYFDRSSIGSSYQQIDHSSKTDLELQGEIRF